MTWRALRERVTRDFDVEELQTLCFDLDVDYDSLRGEGKEAKTRELIGRMRREGRIPELVRGLAERRPSVDWERLVPSGGMVVRKGAGPRNLWLVVGVVVVLASAAVVFRFALPSGLAAPTPTSVPSEMPTATRTATETPTPTATQTATSTETPTSTSTPTPRCPATPVYFQDTWETDRKLGCPTRSWTSDFTYEGFERGLFIWCKSPSPSTIYALYYDSGRWDSQPDPGGPPEPSCPEAEQTGGLGPIHSFGTLWCEPYNWKSRLGLPEEREKDAGNNRIQEFENGMVFTLGSRGGFILYWDSTWERLREMSGRP